MFVSQPTALNFCQAGKKIARETHFSLKKYKMHLWSACWIALNQWLKQHKIYDHSLFKKIWSLQVESIVNFYLYNIDKYGIVFTYSNPTPHFFFLFIYTTFINISPHSLATDFPFLPLWQMPHVLSFPMHCATLLAPMMVSWGCPGLGFGTSWPYFKCSFR